MQVWYRCCRLLLLVLAIGVICAPAAKAHEVRPAYLQIDAFGQDRYRLTWRTPLLSGMRLPVLLGFSDGITVLNEAPEQILSDSVVSSYLIEASGGLAGERISFVGLQATITDVVVRSDLDEVGAGTSLVRPAEPWIAFQGTPGRLQTAQTFLMQGVEHILMGVDHLLFVAALILIVTNTGQLVRTITAFTIAHSITLTAVTLGWLTLPSGPVEILIALSIALMCAEILARDRGRSSLAITAPWMVAFAFGLLHGFGFAGALQELGLPQGDIPLALFSFNVGVEIGQLIFVGVIFLATASLSRTYTLPRWAHVVPTYAIGIISSFWVIERLVATFA